MTKNKEPKIKMINFRITEKEYKEIINLCDDYDISSISHFYRIAGKYHKEWLKRKKGRMEKENLNN